MACVVRADSPCIQLAIAYQLVSSRCVRRSLRHPFGHHSHRTRRHRQRFRTPIALNASHRLLLPQIASWPCLGLARSYRRRAASPRPQGFPGGLGARLVQPFRRPVRLDPLELS